MRDDNCFITCIFESVNRLRPPQVVVDRFQTRKFRIVDVRDFAESIAQIVSQCLVFSIRTLTASLYKLHLLFHSSPLY